MPDGRRPGPWRLIFVSAVSVCLSRLTKIHSLAAPLITNGWQPPYVKVGNYLGNYLRSLSALELLAFGPSIRLYLHACLGAQESLTWAPVPFK